MATKTKAKKPRRQRKTGPVDEFLPGMAPEKNQKVHPLALRYAARRDERIEANVAEKDAHDTLLLAMIEEGLSVYKYGNLRVFVDDHKKCKVLTDAAPTAEANGKEERDDAGT